MSYRSVNIQDGLNAKGRVEIFVTRGSPLLIFGKPIRFSHGRFIYDSCDISFKNVRLIQEETLYNIIVNKGKDSIISSLEGGTIFPVGRMAVGDRGTIPSDPTIPKVPLPTFTTLYNEVYREDCDATSVNIGTPDVHSIQFIKTFNAISIPTTSFSNATNPVINEVGLITFDPAVLPLPRTPVAAPSAPPADEELFSIRTFKSVPFEQANEIAVTIRYTIFIQ